MSMGVPVAILAVLSVIGGWIQFAPLWHPVETWLQGVAEPVVTPTNWQEGISSALAVVLGLLGIYVAWALYAVKTFTVPRFAFAQRVLEHKFYFDELYDAAFYRPAVWLTRALYRGVEEPLIAESSTSLGEDTRDLGKFVARLQTGLLRTYVLAIASSAAVLALVFIAVK
jgi:NADH-quinone oxidoreductase subunit L